MLTTNLGLTIWTSDNDLFDYSVLARNFQAIDDKFSSVSVSSTPIQFVESWITDTLPSRSDGSLIYLTSATTGSCGFSPNTIVQYRNGQWKPISQPEQVTSAPVTQNYEGRIVVFTSASGSFAKGDLAIYTGGAWTKLGGGVSVKSNLTFTPAANQLYVITGGDSTVGANGGPYPPYSLAFYTGAAFKPIVGVPSGAIEIYAGSSAPNGWLLCNGSNYNTTDYPNLYDAIGTTYGASGGAGTFNVPDTRGRTIIGLGSNSDINTLGKNDGVSESSRSPRHNHTVTDPGHSHGISAGYNLYSSGSAQQRTNQTNDPNTTDSAATGITVGISGGALDTPAFIVLNHIIKV